VGDAMTMAATILRLVLAAILAAACGGKIVGYASFAATLRAFVPRLPTVVLRGAAAVVILSEGALSIAVAADVARVAVDAALIAVFAATTVSIAIALVGGIRVECNCFGPLTKSQFSASGSLRSGTFLVLSGVALVLDLGANAPAVPTGWSVLAAATLALLVVVSWQAAGAVATVRQLRDAE
jgi:hypothetical protein